MTHSSPRFRILLQLTAYAACLGLAFACGGTTEADSHGDMTDGPTTDSGPTNSGGNGPVTTGGGNGGGGNGPVTTGVVSNCPSLEPAEGSGCAVDAQVCDYANCTAPDYRDAHTLVCSQGAWQLTELERCDNVPTTCPPSITRGAYCDLPEGSGPCSVVDACGAVRSTYCTNGIWEYGSGTGEDAAPIIPPGSGGAGTGPSSATVTTSPPPEPKCPEIIPEWGTACCPADYPPVCDWTLTSSNIGGGSPSAATGGSPGPTVTGTGSGFGTGDPLLPCAMCGADMTWQTTTCP